MNRKLFLKVALVLMSLSFVSCGQKNDLKVKNNSYKSVAKQVANSSNNSQEQGEKTKDSQDEKQVENKQQNNDLVKTTAKGNQQDTSQNGVFNVAGGTNKVQGICDYYLNGIYVTPRIEPFDNSGNYSHYDIENEDNIYIDVILHVENLSDAAKMAGDIITGKVKIRDNEYTCFSVAENADGSDLESNATINPLETRDIHYVAEVPKTEATGQIEVALTIDGKNYSNKFLLEN